MGRGRKIAFAAAVLGLAAARRTIQDPADVAGTAPSEAPAHAPRKPGAPRPKAPRVDGGNEPYGSAFDLPSTRELLRQIEGAKALTLFIARDKRGEIIALEAQVRHLGEVVDRFYDLLGERNWIFHDDLSVPTVESLISKSADDAERSLIEYYKDADGLRFKVQRLARFPELRARMMLIERAEADFLAGRYYATVQVLLSVMDGFVNDLDLGARRGLHARESDELHAWDSVVGHHLGLTHAHASFARTFRRRSDDPVTELYRNGIVHGMLTNYDNDVVAAKAWNRLFAVADWASSREKRMRPAEPQASWREVLRQVAHNAETRRALDAWSPSTLEATDVGFDDDETVQASRRFLAAWEGRNYGEMAAHLSPMAARATPGKTAGQVRESYVEQQLSGYRLERVKHWAAAACTVDAVITVGGEEHPVGLRWIRSGPDGRGVAPNEDGTWGLMTWTVDGMRRERSKDRSRV
ncbi:MAG: hypothetical protein ACYDAN_13270 [Candidatus Limnocylindrales bacterium]